MRRFHLVQRLEHRPEVEIENPTPLQRLFQAGGFGGRLNDLFVLDYMGSAEFEFGEVPRASKRLSDGKVALLYNFEYEGPAGIVKLDFLWRAKDDPPMLDWERWVKDGMDTKESPHELPHRLNGTKPGWWRDDDDPPRTWETALYWSLGDDVMWGFSEDGYMRLLVEGGTP